MSDSSSFTCHPACPPPLNYSLASRRRRISIAVFFILIFIEAGILPLILFYAIQWGAHLSDTINLAIITSIVGTFSSYKLAVRSWRLFISDRGHQRRPLGAGRFGPDAFTIQISLGMFAFFVPLIIGSSLNPASVNTVAMTLSCFIVVFCFPLLLTSIWPHTVRMPFRVSSMPPWTGLPPAVYTIVEDVVAVDGGGCVEFRQAWRIRYEHSAIMRRICRLTSFYWGASGCASAAAFIVIAWTANDDVAYGIGWGVPWAWAMFSAAITVPWVRKELRREKDEWARPGVHDIFNLHIRQTTDEEKVARDTNAYNESHHV